MKIKKTRQTFCELPFSPQLHANLTRKHQYSLAHLALSLAYQGWFSFLLQIKVIIDSKSMNMVVHAHRSFIWIIHACFGNKKKCPQFSTFTLSKHQKNITSPA